MASSFVQQQDQNANLVTATSYRQFEFPSSISLLSPKLCSIIFQEFLKQMLYAKGQIPKPYYELFKQIESDPTASTCQHNKKRSNPHSIKLQHLSNAMTQCEQSMLNIFEYHMQQCRSNHDNSKRSNSQTQSSIEWVDILLLFGKSYVAPLETYSLRFCLRSNAMTEDHETVDIDDKLMRKISSVIARHLHKMPKIWDNELGITECRVCVRINDNQNDAQYLSDSNFLWKENLCLRFAAQKRRSLRSKAKKKENNLFLINLVNKTTAKEMTKQISLNAADKDKENNIPWYQIHEVQKLSHTAMNADETNETKSWYLSNFKIKGIA